MNPVNPPLSPKDIEEAFIKVTFEEDVAQHAEAGDPFYDPWVDQASAKFSEPAVFGARQLRKVYPNHSIVLTEHNILGFPGALVQPLSLPDVITNVVFVPLARRISHIPGVLVDRISFGAFRVGWDKFDFLLYVAKYPYGFGYSVQHYIVHDGPEERARSLVLAAGAWNAELHEEILVFNSGSWQKDHGLWLEVQKANWADVILKEEFKTNLQKDIYGFFESEKLYKSLAIPWKRGLIMYGPPGNGKTISMKAVMKHCDEKGYAPLYVKSFKSWMGEEASMQVAFDKARQMAPCVLILEDLDSLINDGNRSFFLNQLDGLEGNDGLLIIGSTNHFDRLDPALNSRPSRFDRKYKFDDPDEEERTLYIQYWQNKFKSNERISFPDSLVKDIATSTDGFSFAYLKEALCVLPVTRVASTDMTYNSVSTLVLMAGDEEEREFSDVLKDQVKALRGQLDKNPDNSRSLDMAQTSLSFGVTPREPSGGRLPQVDERSLGQGRIWDATSGPVGRMPGALPASGQQAEGARRREFRTMAYSIGRSFIS
ncbi:P-loop containing nucleoside triphosphate hydrolase protein [Daedaleopsis nitida]|nr:P-loop containing nucleoside triphosphate hydrolase protein [Daedaleopsis nitida]